MLCLSIVARGLENSSEVKSKAGWEEAGQAPGHERGCIICEEHECTHFPFLSASTAKKGKTNLQS